MLTAEMLKINRMKLQRSTVHQITVNLEISRSFYFRETSHVRSFVKIKLSQNGDTTLSFADIGKSCTSREFQRGKYVL